MPMKAYVFSISKQLIWKYVVVFDVELEKQYNMIH